MKTKFLKNSFISALRVLPIKKNKIVFCNFSGRGYGDNPKYIAEEIHSRNLDMDMVWLCNDTELNMAKYIRVVKIWSLRHYFELTTAHVIVSNVRINLGVEKRKGQIYLQTWHGPFCSKKVEGEVENLLDKDYVISAKHDGSITDGIISNSRLLDEQYKRAFWLSKNTEILKIGLPRNDFLIKNANNLQLIKKIKNKLKVPVDSFVILYAPTFRDDYSTEGYKIDFENVLKAFESRLKTQCWILVRLHPNARKQVNEIKFGSRIIDATSYSDIQSLSIASDVIISDYSSTVFDFAILRKPVFICALDLQQYILTRGLLDEFFRYPFPFSESNKELIKKIYEFDYISYKKDLNEYFKKKPIYDEGDASKKAVDWLLLKMEKMI